MDSKWRYTTVSQYGALRGVNLNSLWRCSKNKEYKTDRTSRYVGTSVRPLPPSLEQGLVISLATKETAHLVINVILCSNLVVSSDIEKTVPNTCMRYVTGDALR